MSADSSVIDMRNFSESTGVHLPVPEQTGTVTIYLYYQVVSSPLHQQLSREFRSRIASGQWPEGVRAPSEAALCAEFGVSRGPIRQAMASLRADGLLVGGQGRPPLVRRNVPEHSATVLGSFTAWADSEGHRPGQRTLLQSRHAADAHLAESLGVEVADPVLTIVRVRTLDDEPALIERATFIWEIGRRLMEFDPDSGSINRFLLDNDVDLYSSDHLLDAVAADAEDAEALGVDVGSPLMRVRRRTQDSAGRIIECADDRYVPGHCSIRITNHLTAAAGGMGKIRLA